MTYTKTPLGPCGWSGVFCAVGRLAEDGGGVTLPSAGS